MTDRPDPNCITIAAAVLLDAQGLRGPKRTSREAIDDALALHEAAARMIDEDAREDAPRIEHVTLERDEDGKPIGLVRAGEWQPLGGTFREAHERAQAHHGHGTFVVPDEVRDRNRMGMLDGPPRCRGTIVPVFDAPSSDALDIVFDGPPSHESGRFVEVEDMSGAIVNAGTWIDRGDGFWALRIAGPSSPAPLKDDAGLAEVVEELLEQSDRADGLQCLLDDALIERDLMVAGVRTLRGAWKDLKAAQHVDNVFRGEVEVGILDTTLDRLSGILERIPGDPAPEGLAANVAAAKSIDERVVTVADWHRLIDTHRPLHMTVEDVCRGILYPDAPLEDRMPGLDRGNMAERSIDRLVDYLRQVRDLFDATYRGQDPDTLEAVLVPLRGIVNASADLIDGKDPVARILASVYEADPRALKPTVRKGSRVTVNNVAHVALNDANIGDTIALQREVAARRPRA